METEEERWPTIDRLVNESHDLWEKTDVRFAGLLEKISDHQRVAMLCAKLNYQVENGGFDQWYVNEYGKEGPVDQLDRFLMLVGTPHALEVAEMIQKFKNIVDRYGNYSNDADDGESTEYMTRVDELDSAFYKINTAFMDGVESWLSARA